MALEYHRLLSQPQTPPPQGFVTVTDGVYPAFAVLVVAMIVFQKLALNVGDGSIGINTFILWLGLGWMVFTSRSEFVASRVLLLGAVILSVVIGLGRGEPLTRPTAILIILAMYCGFVVRIKVTSGTALRCFKVFQWTMVAVALIVIGQQAIQYTIGSQYWPNLDRIIPEAFLYPGFAYLRPYAWNSPYFEPNGIFFLEPSILSFYLAVAFVIEVLWFQETWRLALYGAAILGCLAITGPLTLLLTSPLWVGSLQTKKLLILGIIGASLIATALWGGWLDALLARSGELTSDSSSGYARIILPLQSIVEHLDNTDMLTTGHGPGSSPHVTDLVQWPFSKLLYEYGLLTAILFHVFFLVCLFDRPPSRALCCVMIIPYLFFGGGFVAHSNVMPLLLFGSLLSVDEPR